jgi:hypothetical protein
VRTTRNVTTAVRRTTTASRNSSLPPTICWRKPTLPANAQSLGYSGSPCIRSFSWSATATAAVAAALSAAVNHSRPTTACTSPISSHNTAVPRRNRNTNAGVLYSHG